MLDDGNRGCLINDNIDDIVKKIEQYIYDKKIYFQQVNRAKKWSQQFTLDSFQEAIKKLI
jgi:hypothetical protein